MDHSKLKTKLHKNGVLLEQGNLGERNCAISKSNSKTMVHSNIQGEYLTTTYWREGTIAPIWQAIRVSEGAHEKKGRMENCGLKYLAAAWEIVCKKNADPTWWAWTPRIAWRSYDVQTW